LLLAKDKDELTAWHYASIGGKIQALKILWELGKETLTAEELNNKLLLSKDILGKTAWHLAAEEGNQEALEELWEFGN
jgi:ankyrin repeat protein